MSRFGKGVTRATMTDAQRAKVGLAPATGTPGTKKRSGGGGGGDLTSGLPMDIVNNYLIPGASDVANDSQDLRDQSIAYGTNNPWATAALPYVQNMLSGDMTANPWEKDLYGDLSGVNVNDAMSWLRDYIGVGPGGSGGASSGVTRSPNSGRGGDRGYVRNEHGALVQPTSSYYSSSSGGGPIPDTIGGSSRWAAEQIRGLADPSNFDPANNPTLRPLLDQLRNEASEDFYSMIGDLSSRAEGAGLYGTGGYEALINRAREESMESLDQQIAQLLYGDYNNAQNRRMEGIGLAQQSDIAAMQDATNRYGIDTSARSAGAGAAAAAADAAEARKLQAMSMLLGTGQNLMGLRGDMANMRQSGQLGALNAGLGYGNMGLDAYRTGAGFDQNRLGAYGLMGDVAQGIVNARNAAAGNAISRGHLNLARQSATQDSLNSLLNIMMGIGGMGGTQYSTDPGVPYVQGPPAWLQGVGAGIGTAMNTYGAGMWGR